MKENPEYLQVTLDSSGKVIEGVQNNGMKYLGAGMNIDGNEYYVVENPEWIRAVIDSDNKILCGIKYDGKFYADLDGVDEQVKELIQPLMDDVEELVDRFDEIFKLVDNPEFMSVELDSEDKVLGGRKIDGTKFENVGLDIEGTILKSINDPEGRKEIKTDSDEKIISYRKEDGTLVENAGIETNYLELTEQGMTDFQQALKDAGFIPGSEKTAKDYHVPEYGTFDIVSETFYLTADNRYSDKNGVYLIQDWADTNENAMRDKDTGQIHESGQPVSLSSYYIKSTLINNGDGTYSKYNDGVEGHDVQLVFYAANKVTKVGNLYYVTSTLVDGQVVPESIEVTQIIDTPQYMAWPVEKSSEHHCLANINFGYYFTKNNVPIGVKYQGQSTIYRRKRNFRITFYKKNDYKKKDKIKVGELVRLSGYNLKANWSDATRIKEFILYRIILGVWLNRPQNNRFPWDNEFGYYTGATGFINGFPCQLNFGGNFFGLDIFSLKKDEKNYMLDGDDDHSGIFVCGNRRDGTCWKHSYANNWDDEMIDEMSQETNTALYNFLRFISEQFEGSDGNTYRWHELTYFVDDYVRYDFSIVGNKDGKIYLYPEYGGNEIKKIYVTSTLVDGLPTENSISCEFVGLNKSEISERMDVQGFIDYFICMQSFAMWDSICRNMILHTRSDKKKFYPFFYDLDLSMKVNYAYNRSVFDMEYDIINGQRITYDMTLWENIVDIYWDEIVNRYAELRNSVLSIDYIKSTYHKGTDVIPNSDYIKENTKWGNSGNKSSGDALINEIEKRLNWLDENYFIV